MLSYYYEEPEYLATDGEADREFAHNAGHDNPDCAWILSNRDVWYPNPFYRGEPQPHPESVGFDDDEF